MMMFLNQRLNSIGSWFSLFMKNLIHEWSQEAIIVIRLDHPQCPKLGRLWMQAEPSESQGRIISKHCFIKRPFLDVKCKIHNKLNFIQFWDIGPAKTTLCAQTPSSPPPIAKTSAGSGENLFILSILAHCKWASYCLTSTYTDRITIQVMEFQVQGYKL